MAAGSFSLYYKDSNDTKIACVGVRYRIIRVSDGMQVASGTTGDNGATQSVSPDEDPLNATWTVSQPWETSPARKSAHPSPLLPETIVRYRLHIWNDALKDWSEPDFHPTQVHRDMDVQRESLALPAAAGSKNVSPEVVLVSKQLRIVPSFEVLFRMKAGAMPIPDAPYVAYRLDKNGREIVATDVSGRPVRGNTRKDGTTGRIRCVDPLVFRFDLAGTGITQKTARLVPTLPGTTPAIQVLEVKSLSAMTSPNEGAVGKVGGKISAPAILNAESEELILLEPKIWQEFEELSGRIESTFAGVHMARGNLSAALQGRSQEEIKAAEDALGLAEDRVAKMLNENFAKKADLQELITFETYDKGRTTGNGGVGDRMGLRRRYIPRSKYEDLKRRRIMGIPIKVDLKASAKATAGPASAGSKAGHDPLSKKNFDREAFLKSLRKITAEAKVKVKEWKTDTAVLDMIDLGGNQFSNAVEHSESFSTETQAQWLRCVAGAGASSEFNWDPEKGRVSANLQGSAQAKLVLFEGRYLMSYAVPSVKGWQMHFAGEDLGAIVFVLACELYGFAGAKASATGCVGVSVESGKARIKPLVRDRDDRLSTNYDARAGLPRANLDNDSRGIVPGGLNEKVPKEEEINGMKVQVEAFAGVEGGLMPSGEIKWLPPEQREPVSFAKLTTDIAGSAGAGASGQLYIYYANGKFRIKASARLCWGLGAKGALDFAVDAGGMLEFVKWVYYQLAHAGFKALAYIAKDAFDALSRIMYIAIIEGTLVQGAAVDKLLKQSAAEIDTALDEINMSLDRAQKRIEMAKNINKKPAWLIYATPETRGMLLHQLIHHDWASHTRDLPSVGIGWDDVQVHYMEQHKEAALNIFKCVRTISEWSNVLQHMTPEGGKAGNAGQAEGDVLRFLNYGISLTKDLGGDVFDMLNKGDKPKDMDNRYIEDYIAHRNRLLGAYPKGYEVATLDHMDTNMLAHLDGQDSAMFAMMSQDSSWLQNDQQRIMLAMMDSNILPGSAQMA